jgi:tetraacyldisaccharide 4'-kinase
VGALYGRVATRRRTWHARHPHARRRLARPVISVGNLVVGGSGKTPTVAALAQILSAGGERPSILSRGYARRATGREVVVVSNGEQVLEPVSRSGDEPQMLARALPGVPVLVSADRYEAGAIAEGRLGCTVHVLDDGFQHLRLARDVDLLMVAPADLDDHVLPAGRLREPLSSARAADAVLVADGVDATSIASHLGVPTAFRVVTSIDAPRAIQPFGAPVPQTRARALAFAGVARPERFFDAVRRQGWDVVRTIAYRDHHWFTATDLDRLVGWARSLRADVILTTEKDAMRLLDLPLASDALFAYLPMSVSIDPAARFETWLRERLTAARSRSDRSTHA